MTAFLKNSKELTQIIHRNLPTKPGRIVNRASDKMQNAYKMTRFCHHPVTFF